MLPAELKLRLRLYAIVDGALPETLIGRLIAGGITALQLREKLLPDEVFIARGRRLARLCRESGILFLINDRVELCGECRADGVHVGQTDDWRLARRKLAATALLGISAGSPAQALAAREAGADYIGIGPVFPTASKPDAGPAIGLSGLAAVRAAVPGLPLVAIGGIQPANVRQVLSAGADAVAVISTLVEAKDPEQQAAKLLAILDGSRAPGREDHGTGSRKF